LRRIKATLDLDQVHRRTAAARAERRFAMRKPGVWSKEVAAITGHASLREIERYTKAAEQERLARQAIAGLIRNG
jgi:hypothetical protein